MQPNLETEDASPLGLRFWMMLVLTGVAAGLVGGLLMKLLHGVEHLVFAYSAGGFLEAVRRVSARRRLLAELCAGLFAAGMAIVVSRMQGEVGLDGAIWQRSGRIPVVKGLVSAVGSIVTVGMGAAIGRENALKQAGGVIGNMAAMWRNLPDDQRRLLVACGGGAGMAAAYNVPLGGAMFALEVLLGSFAAAQRGACVCGVAACGGDVVADAAGRGDVQDFGFGGDARADRVGGACRTRVRLGGCRVYQAAGLGQDCKAEGLAGGGAADAQPGGAGAGGDAVSGNAGQWQGCRAAFVRERGGPTELLLVLFVLRPLATAVIVRSGVPGGLFTPAMSLGAVAGSLLGRLWAAMGAHREGQMPSCALIGSAAVLAATTQGPVSALVFVLELTRTADALMVPLLVAVVTATLVTRRFEKRSIYSTEGGERRSRGGPGEGHRVRRAA